ncbi:hypothetical protein Q8F55_004073 [Vanrija albida]|uniref:Uncharacterized protein n=1 Tax=Vanrija albida TaxID=181172 RepID=A0ABR3Q5Q7_9TREE
MSCNIVRRYVCQDTIVGVCRERIANEQRRVSAATADLTTGVMTAWITYYFVEAAWFAARPVRFGDAAVAIDLTEDVYRPDAFRPRSLIVAAASRARGYASSPTPAGDMSAELPPYEAASAESASASETHDFALSTGHGGSWDDHGHGHGQYNMFAACPGPGRVLADRKGPAPGAPQPVRSLSERSDGSWLVVRNGNV